MAQSAAARGPACPGCCGGCTAPPSPVKRSAPVLAAAMLFSSLKAQRNNLWCGLGAYACVAGPHGGPSSTPHVQSTRLAPTPSAARPFLACLLGSKRRRPRGALSCTAVNLGSSARWNLNGRLCQVSTLPLAMCLLFPQAHGLDLFVPSIVTTWRTWH